MPETDNKAASLEWKDVESTAINRIAYDQMSQRIYVEFKRGAVYRYNDCSQELWSLFMDTDSAGSFVHDMLKGHTYTEVEA